MITQFTRCLPPLTSRLLLFMLYLPLLLIGAGLLDPLLIHPTSNPARDFDMHWLAAKLTLQGQATATYNEQVMSQALWSYYPDHPKTEGSVGYLYPPSTLLLLAPLGKLQPAPALWVFNGLSLLAMLGIGIWAAGVRGVLLVMALPTIWLCLIAGQVSLMVSALMAGGVLLLNRFPRLSGLCWGACLLKPQLALLLPMGALARRSWPCLLTAAGVVAALIACSAYLFPGAWQIALQQIGQTAHWLIQQPLVSDRQSTILAAMTRLGASSALALAAQTLMTCLAVSAAFWLWAHTADAGRQLCILGAATILALPFGYDYDLTLLVLPLLGLLRLSRQTGLTAAELVYAAAMLILSLALLMSQWRGPVLTLIVLGQPLLLLCLTLRQHVENTAKNCPTRH